MGLLTSHRAHMAVGLQQLWDPARTSSNPSLLLTSTCNSFSTAWKKRISISQVYDQKQVSLHASKRRECSQTVHYLGFLDMAAQTTWPHSSLEKKKARRKSDGVNYSVWFQQAYLFFWFVGIDSECACCVTAVINCSFHYSFTSAHVLCINICCWMQLLWTLQGTGLLFPRQSECVMMLTIPPIDYNIYFSQHLYFPQKGKQGNKACYIWTSHMRYCK